MKEFNLSTKVIFDGSLVDYFQANNCNKVFIVADPMIERLGFMQGIKDCLDSKGSLYSIFQEITPDPTIETIAKGVWQMDQFQPECVVAIGGGSAIDAAKGMLLSNHKLSAAYQQPLFIAVPSTSGTGSEVTSFTVITNGQDKKPFIDQRIVPNVAILDVNLVKSVPAKITADTGMDVLTHAIEAYVSTNSSTFTDALAEKTVQLVFENLIEAFNHPDNLIARSRMHEASALAGMAFTNTSLGINHSLAHAIGGLHHLSHGRINAILMPSVIAFNAQSELGEKYQKLAKLLGMPASTVEEGVHHLIVAVQMLNEALHIEQDFASLGVSQANYEQVADQIAAFALQDGCTATNPRTVTANDLKDIYLSLYSIGG